MSDTISLQWIPSRFRNLMLSHSQVVDNMDGGVLEGAIHTVLKSINSP